MRTASSTLTRNSSGGFSCRIWRLSSSSTRNTSGATRMHMALLSHTSKSTTTRIPASYAEPRRTLPPVAQPLYESIGVDYTSVRRPDPRIERQIHDRLAGATPVVNLGAGTGSYEPADRAVVAVDPSTVMIAQRRPGSAPVVRAVAEQLPFAAGVFAGAMAVLTVHHWPDPDAGLAEVRRIDRGPVVVLPFAFEIHVRQWLITEYLPAMAGI